MFPRRLPALLRLLIAALILGLFIYGYFSKSLSSNAVLAPLVKGQFSASLYGTGLAAATAVIALTLIFGRLYCSVLCPLGTLQELVWQLRKNSGGRRNQGSNRVRYIIPLLAGAGAALAFSPLMMVFDPISTFGRGMGAVRALFDGNAAVFTVIIAVPLAAVLVTAFFRGRFLCSWCPVGLTLGLFSSAAPFGMKISSRCVSCGACEKKCPAGCIDSREKQIRRGDCVLCFSCVSVCPAGSVSYGGREKAAAAEGRRVFLKGAGKLSILCGAAYLLAPSVRLFSSVRDRVSDQAGSGGAVLPPGALNARRYQGRCVGCQACVSACPAGVIKTSGPQLRPSLDYTGAGCLYNCVECGKVCPTGAIRRLSVEEKRRTRVALSSLHFERCVVNTKLESCGACAEVCPTGAITMTAYGESGVPWLTRPVFDAQYCIGCGLCYAACPAEPRALVIEAVPEQTLTAGPRPSEEAGDELQILNTDDFPF